MSSPPETERTGPRQEAGPTITSTEPEDSASDDWRARFAEQLAERRRRKAIAEEIRRQFAVARSAGLRRRHAAKLARRGGGRR